jgi:hypothetical protein
LIGKPESGDVLAAGATGGSDSDRVALGAGYSLPRRFDLRSEPADPRKPRVQIWWEVVDGVPACVGVHVSPGPGARLTTAGLRVPIASYLRAAVEIVAAHADTGQPVWFADPAQGGIEAATQELARVKPTRGVPVTESTLLKTAALWREAVAKNRPRTAYICEELPCSSATAARYIREARVRGFIPRSDQ